QTCALPILHTWLINSSMILSYAAHYVHDRRQRRQGKHCTRTAGVRESSRPAGSRTMLSISQSVFASFRLDPGNACVWHGTEMLPLTPKAFAVLQYLVAHAGQLVTKEVLLAAVWPGMAVSEGVLKVCLSEILKALGDTVKTPRFIATVHRRGYRFIAPVTEAEPAEAQGTARTLQRLPGAAPSQVTPGLVGRRAALAQLHSSLAKALQGQRQLVFVTGE